MTDERDAEARLWDERERLEAELESMHRTLFHHDASIGWALYRQLADRVESINNGLRRELLRRED